MSARALMVQGCTSDAGKSALVTALGRWLQRRGVRVAPFKPQNMALNSAVALDGGEETTPTLTPFAAPQGGALASLGRPGAGEETAPTLTPFAAPQGGALASLGRPGAGEIGRAQAVQAQACGIAPHTDMNPVLLKPNSDTGCQVIIQGRALGNMEAQDYHAYKPRARAAVLDSFARLARQYEAIVVEGAGSPAEINLRAGDIANMGFAEAVDCPVILVADIDRGGVFAHLVGTLALLSEGERARVRGFVINRFRGDLALLQPGLDWLERETGKPVLGVLPYLHGLHLEAEDALPPPLPAGEGGRLRVAVPVLPRIANHTDFDALRLHPGVDFRFVPPHEALPAADLVILPGSKSVRADLAHLRACGWAAQLHRHLRYGGRLLGICGGFQMLGQAIHDPLGLEGEAGSSEGLGWLEMETTLAADKQLRNVRGRLALGDAPVAGYEIHAGISRGPALAHPLLLDCAAGDGGQLYADGARTRDGQIAGTYLHGLFDTPAAAQALLAWAGLGELAARLDAPDIHALREAAIDRLADAVENHLDTQRLLDLLT